MSLADMVQFVREDPSVELEARFGTCTDKCFVSGVERSFLDQIIEALQLSPVMRDSGGWKEGHDVFFTHNGNQHRTRVDFNSDSMDVKSETILKRKIMQKTFKTMNTGNIYDACLHDIRVSVQSEQLVVDKLPLSVNPNLIRIKQTRHFTTACGAWRFDFSLTWAGTSKSDAEANQMKNDPVFEFELELIDPTYLTTRSNEHVAASLLLKMCDFLPPSAVLTHFSL